MDGRILNGSLLTEMLKAGFQNLKNNVDEVNDLNVFPIPDGDTGDNMLATLSGGIKNITGEELKEVCAAASTGFLMGARGNSGVILSQMLSGALSYLGEFDEADVNAVAEAFINGTKKAYAAVSVPVEGTMLTVIREAGEGAKEAVSDSTDLTDYFNEYLRIAKVSLSRTPELLPVLKEAGVIDSGGQGVVYLVKGFINALTGEKTDYAEVKTEDKKDVDFSKFGENDVMEYGYCTEFLLQLTRAKTNIEEFSLDEMKSTLSDLGNSIVAIKSGSVVKVHIHTFDPGQVLKYANTFGEFLTVKVENMTLQHNENVAKEEFTKIEKRRVYGTVAVADGEGLISTFKELGADIVIDGGQGNNPSVERFIKAFEAVNCDNIFVLPNNGNVYMAAVEAAKAYNDSSVRVVKTTSIGEGYSVLSSLDYSIGDSEAIFAAMQKDAAGSYSLMISEAVRDLAVGNIEVKKGGYIGFKGKDILCFDSDRANVFYSLSDKYVSDKDLVILFFGKNVKETEKQNVRKYMELNHPAVEFYAIDGGQSVYDYVVIAE